MKTFINAYKDCKVDKEIIHKDYMYIQATKKPAGWSIGLYIQQNTVLMTNTWYSSLIMSDIHFDDMYCTCTHIFFFSVFVLKINIWALVEVFFNLVNSWIINVIIGLLDLLYLHI